MATLRKNSIGLDVDGVIANFGKRLLEVALEMGYTNLPRRWYEQVEWKPGGGEWDIVWEAVHKDPDFWLSIEPFYDDPPPAYTPKVYITSRPVPSKVTETWLEEHGFPRAPVITVSRPEEKVEAFKHSGVTAFVDDRPDSIDYFEREVGETVHIYVMDRPWNKCVISSRRVYTVNEAEVMENA